MDKAGKKYWNDSWAGKKLPSAVDPYQPGLNNYVNRRFHEYFCEVFSCMKTYGMNLLEIGCARSTWLPYFAKEFGFKVYGIDYSEIGCQQASQILLNEHVYGEVVCADLFLLPKFMLEAFDVVFSFGVAEHFLDTSACIAALSKFLKPGGLIVTNIPNMAGLIGYVQKMINRPVYNIHKPLDKEALFKAHQESGLEVSNYDYFISTNFGVCNLTGLPMNTRRWLVKKIILAVLRRFSMTMWLVESKMSKKFKATILMSAYINCIAHKF